MILSKNVFINKNLFIYIFISNITRRKWIDQFLTYSSSFLVLNQNLNQVPGEVCVKCPSKKRSCDLCSNPKIDKISIICNDRRQWDFINWNQDDVYVDLDKRIVFENEWTSFRNFVYLLCIKLHYT